MRLSPRDGDPLTLTFTRDAKRLVSARSRSIALVFSDASRYRDESLPGHAYDAEIRWIGLPTRTMPDAEVGGWQARWTRPAGEAVARRSGPAFLFEASVSGRPARIALDARADGPLRVRPALGETLGLAFQTDVLGRRVAKGGTLDLGGVVFPSISLEETQDLDPGADATAGAALFRETIVELAAREARIRIHDPARWVAPEGFFRVVLDDDGNRPVAILQRGAEALRLLAGVASRAPIVLEPEAARRLKLDGEGDVAGLRWGALHLPPVRVGIEATPLERQRAEDGSLGFELLSRVRVFLDMPHRWVYVGETVDR